MVRWVSLCRANKCQIHSWLVSAPFLLSVLKGPPCPPSTHIFIITQAIFSFDATNLIFFHTCSILSPRTHSGLCKIMSPHHRLIIISDCPLLKSGFSEKWGFTSILKVIWMMIQIFGLMTWNKIKVKKYCKQTQTLLPPNPAWIPDPDVAFLLDSRITSHYYLLP